MELYYYVFILGKNAYCVWGDNLKSDNLKFINEIDPSYFNYHQIEDFEKIDNDETDKLAQYAAIRIRMLYSQALEVFFALLGATIQAPFCVPIWLDLYNPRDVKDIVENIQQNKPSKSLFKDDIISWFDVSCFIFDKITFTPGEPRSPIIQAFSKLWSRFARDFLDKDMRNEYNSIKHGMRVTPSRSSFYFGKAHGWGKPASPHEMQKVGKSSFGTNFIVSQKSDRFKHHLIYKQQRLNWHPMQYVSRLELISKSIENIKARLQILNGMPADKVKFFFPFDIEYFNKPWEAIGNPGIIKFSTGGFFPPTEIMAQMTKKKIEEEYGKFRFIEKADSNELI